MNDKGYDPKEVPKKLCFSCKKLIGNLQWREVTILERFGQMLFEHVECPTEELDGSSQQNQTT